MLTPLIQLSTCRACCHLCMVYQASAAVYTGCCKKPSKVRSCVVSHGYCGSWPSTTVSSKLQDFEARLLQGTGLSEQELRLCDSFVYIPQLGQGTA